MIPLKKKIELILQIGKWSEVSTRRDVSRFTQYNFKIQLLMKISEKKYIVLHFWIDWLFD